MSDKASHHPTTRRASPRGVYANCGVIGCYCAAVVLRGRNGCDTYELCSIRIPFSTPLDCVQLTCRAEETSRNRHLLSSMRAMPLCKIHQVPLEIWTSNQAVKGVTAYIVQRRLVCPFSKGDLT